MALVTVQRSPTSSSPSHDGLPIFHDGVDPIRSPKSLSECYFAGKGTALVLPDADGTAKARASGGCGVGLGVDGANCCGQSPAAEGAAGGVGSCGGAQAVNGGSSNIQRHLQSMFYLLRSEETLKMAVKLESVHPTRTRYLVVVSRMCNRGEESCLLGIDCNERTTVGLVLKVLANTEITLDGDGGFSVTICDRHHIFKPVSVQAMWSALQTLHKVSAKAREQNYFQGGSTHGWVDYYEERIESDRSCLNEWHAMDNLESKRPPSPGSVRTKPTEREETEHVIRTKLKELMMSVDLDEVTSKFIRSRLEEDLDMDLGEYKSFLDQEMLVILGQMDAPTEIFDHVYLGSEWNASNYEELQRNGVGHILNVTREIDNFFPGYFDYLNIRVYDDEKTDLLKHWDDTFKYITKAKDKGSKVLVHCKMGVSRSASVVIAYAMKAFNWDFNTALRHVKEKRTCIKPNSSFLLQLETYQGILDAMKNKEKLQRSKSETNLKSPGSNGKSEKVLAGSEPTPVVQAMSKSYDLENRMSGQDLRQMGSRPKSWSPENFTTRELAEAVKSSPVFMSLEDISQKSSSKESIKESKASLTRHVLMPCDNGESYSVSPNQIVHLPGHDLPVTREGEKKNVVMDLAIHFEKERDKEKDLAHADKLKDETWDPGEKKLMDSSSSTEGENRNSTSRNCDLLSVSDSRAPVWTSSTTLKTESVVPPPFGANDLVKVPSTKSVCDPFSNQVDRVFDREEKRQQRMSTIPVISSEPLAEEKAMRECPSRQSSWSSYDSAVVMGFPSGTELSRHSSWGSGDTRTLPSRNSSWGSYDMRPRGAVHYVNEKGEKVAHSSSEIFESSSCGIFPYDREDIPWHPGTVRRSKQKIEEGTNTKRSSVDSLASSYNSLVKTPSSETLLFSVPAEAVNTVLVEASNMTTTNPTTSAISEKIDIPKEKSHSRARLSISAPEPSSMELVVSKDSTLSLSASNVSSSVISTAQCSSVKQHRTFLENLQQKKTHPATKKVDEHLDPSSNSGKVRNLKREFEAKSSTNEQGEQADVKVSKSKVSSLPSSPVSVHQTKDNKASSGEDTNLKNLIGIFENNRESTHINRRNKYPGTTLRNTRHSCIEMSYDRSHHTITAPEKTESDYKRPPIVPVVRNAASSGLMVAKTVITAAKKKQQQQYGKSHPLARLNIKPRHNNPVYNTM